MKKFLITIFTFILMNIVVLEMGEYDVKGVESIRIDNVKTNIEINTTTIDKNDSMKSWDELQKRYCSSSVNIEVSHYSENESTDTPGCEAIGSTGKYLDNGDIAMPYEFPAWTQIRLKNKSGEYINNGNGGDIFTNTDRGNPRIVTTYSNPDSHGNELRVDRYIRNASSSYLNKLGVSNCTMEVVRWGRDKPIDTSNKVTVNTDNIEISSNITMTIN